MVDKVSLFDARMALEENVLQHINSKTMPILKNQNVALIGICDCLERMSRDLDMLHSKLQPILKSLSDDQEDWQQRVRPGT